MQATIENFNEVIGEITDWDTVQSDKWFIALDDRGEKRLCIIADGCMLRLFMEGSIYEYVIINPVDDFPEGCTFIRYLEKGEQICITVT